MPSKKLIESTVLSAVGATGDGVWMDVTSWRRTTVHIDGITTATVEIDGSCAPTKPADNTHGVKMTEVTTDTIVEVTTKLKWIKVRVTAWTAGAINSYLVGESTAYGI